MRLHSNCQTGPSSHLFRQVWRAPVLADTPAGTWKTTVMAENKYLPSESVAEDFLGTVEDPRRREDSYRLLELMREATGRPAVMWGANMVGFGSYHYRYDSGREGDSLAVGFSPRKKKLALYGLSYAPEAAELLSKLGKHKKGEGCVYINSLDDVDRSVLRELIRTGYEYVTTHLDRK